VQSLPRLEDLVDRVWPGSRDRARIEPLGGGITNHNFRVDLDGESFVLRIGGKDTTLLGIDRHAEEVASQMAATLGIGPQVVSFMEPEGYLVTRFILGEPVAVDRMRTPPLVERVASALRSIHSEPVIHGRFDAHRVVEVYAETAADHGVELPHDYRWAKSLSDRIEAGRGPQPQVPCHNDLLNANFIDDGERLRIVDWEYAGMGDRFFDLANFSINHEFEPEHDDILLGAYFGEVRQQDVAALRLMRFMSDFREAMWGLVQQGISELDFDFVAYTNEHFERLRATAAAPRFEQFLATVAAS
jgi:thiamine kinase-like enzyme